MKGLSKLLMIAVVWLLSLVTLSVSAQNSTQPVQSLTVLDANAKKVGKLLSIGGDGNQTPVFNLVAFKVRKNLLTLGVTANGFLGSDSQLFFASFDCSGAAFFNLTATFPQTLPDTASRTAVSNGKVFSPDGSASETVNVNSFLTSLNSPGNASCLQSSFSLDVLRSQLVIDLGTQFSAPFSVVATPAEN